MKTPAIVSLLLAAVLGTQALAGEVHVAVAANFTEPAKEIAAAFREKTGHDAVLSFGATGQLYAQITQDAPFGVFLSADAERPQQAIDEGLAEKGSRFTYAVGRLVLWSRDASRKASEDALREGDFQKLAIANPQAAPYGAAAVEVLRSLGVLAAVESRLVQGNNITQTFQFVDTGNAEFGFVAAAQLAGRSDGSRWLVPEHLHRPIRQDAVLLRKAAGNEAAAAFVAFLKGPEARAIIERYGYGTGDGGT